MSSGDEATPAKRYDLEERTAQFGETIIAYAKRIPANLVTQPLIPQLVDSGTSVGANYCEADNAGSRRSSGIELVYVNGSRARPSTGCG